MALVRHVARRLQIKEVDKQILDWKPKGSRKRSWPQKRWNDSISSFWINVMNVTSDQAVDEKGWVGVAREPRSLDSS